MSTTIKTNNGTEYQKSGYFRNAVAITGGGAVATAIQLSSDFVGIPITNKNKNINKGIDTLELKTNIVQAMKKSGLEQNGVQLVDYTGAQVGKPVKEVFKTIEKTLSYLEGKTQKQQQKILKTGIDQAYMDFFKTIIKNGDNAAFIATKNKKQVLVNIEKFGTTAFHELGHAINFTTSKFWRGMQKARLPLMVIPSVISSIALFKHKKVEGEEPKGIIDKTTTFIKNNAGKLTTLSFIPIIAEELKATANGNKLAKEICSPELYKKVIKSNRFGAITYIGVAILSGVAIFVGNKIKDNIAKPKEI